MIKTVKLQLREQLFYYENVDDNQGLQYSLLLIIKKKYVENKHITKQG